MGRQTQAAAVAANGTPSRDTRTKLEQRCDKLAWKVKKLESQVWKLEWQVRADTAKLSASARARLKQEIEEIIEDLHASIEGDLRAIAGRL